MYLQSAGFEVLESFEAKSLRNRFTVVLFLSSVLLLLASMEFLNVNPVSLATVGKKNGASLGTFGASFGLFLCWRILKNIEIIIHQISFV